MFSNFKEDLKSILGIHQNPHFWRFFPLFYLKSWSSPILTSENEGRRCLSEERAVGTKIRGPRG